MQEEEDYEEGKNNDPSQIFNFVFEEIENKNIKMLITKLISDLELISNLKAKTLMQIQDIKEKVEIEITDPLMNSMPISIEIRKLIDKMEDLDMLTENELNEYTKTITGILNDYKKIPPQTTEDELTKEEEPEQNDEETPKEHKIEENIKKQEIETEEKENAIKKDLELLEKIEKEKLNKTIPEMKQKVKNAFKKIKEGINNEK